jgi:hypothetical protein
MGAAIVYPRKEKRVGTECHSATADVLLLYAGESFRDQIGLWAFHHPQRRVDVSCERSLPAIRQLLSHVRATVVDATEDPSQATDAFLQAVARLGAAAVTMYSESAHDDLELFVRMRGSLFLLGPLLDQQWEEVLERLLHAKRPLPVVRVPAPQRLSLVHSPHGNQRRIHYVNRPRDNFE